jgi:predicted metalloprotease with PDZ domain
VTDNLVAVGIDNFTADTIGREQNDLALRRLELRDKAVRANYFDSDRYRDELQILNDATKSIRQEVGDEFYDRYLYASRQPTRLRISSVMTTSAAESAGISDGDVLVSYAAQRIFSLGDLQASTSQGVRNEPVGITVIRGDREMSLTISRGPLGVQLIPTRVDPANQ